MLHSRLLLIAGSAMIASACSTVPAPAPLVREETVYPPVPPAAEVPCAVPVAIPDRAISEGEATSLWLVDRRELVTCEERRAAAVAAMRPPGGR
jgi:hypothetical protein